MTSLRQIEANRRDAIKSTGPKTTAGKMQSRRNAVRHGLSAETVIEIVEDIEDYRGFEAAIIADFDARTAVERELVLRLASLLWRLRPATVIETDLLSIQACILRERRLSRTSADRGNCPSTMISVATPFKTGFDNGENPYERNADQEQSTQAQWASHPMSSARQLPLCFQRLANLDNAVFERLERYESTLARQVAQTIILLQSVRVR